MAEKSGGTQKRGFAAMSDEKQREVSRKGAEASVSSRQDSKSSGSKGGGSKARKGEGGGKKGSK